MDSSKPFRRKPVAVDLEVTFRFYFRFPTAPQIGQDEKEFRQLLARLREMLRELDWKTEDSPET